MVDVYCPNLPTNTALKPEPYQWDKINGMAQEGYMDDSWAYKKSRGTPIEPRSRELTPETLQRAKEYAQRHFHTRNGIKFPRFGN